MIYWLGAEPDSPFPPLEMALHEPNGLLAAGGDLHPLRLLKAYHHGVFPWYSDEQPILWWSPDPRCILPLKQFHCSRRLRRELRKSPVTITMNQDFKQTLCACAETPRKAGEGTWIVSAMRTAYQHLHDLGFAHSIEVWLEGQMVGGLYGVRIGRMFYAESMFTRSHSGSKIALMALCYIMSAGGAKIIDCQLNNPHLVRMGACEIERDEFLQRLEWHTSRDFKGGWPQQAPTVNELAHWYPGKIAE